MAEKKPLIFVRAMCPYCQYRSSGKTHVTARQANDTHHEFAHADKPVIDCDATEYYAK